MRHCSHFLSLVKQSALLNMFDRAVIVKDKATCLLANLEDLEVTIPLYSSISEATNLQVPRHILDFYKNVFQSIENEHKDLSEDDPMFGMATVERLVAVHNLKSQSKISSDTVRTYMKTLKDKAIIDSKDDPNDKRHQLYFSISRIANSLDFLGKESSSFFSEIDLESYLKGEVNYLTKNGMHNFLFSPSLADLDKGNTINLLEKIDMHPILVRYFVKEKDLESSLKTENRLIDTLPSKTKID
jgi:hypothetical protein